jgi:hypothetical protein
MPLADGAATAQELGMCVLVTQGSGDELQPIVVEQHPAPGSEAVAGAVTTIVIDTLEDISAAMDVIGEMNEEMSCTGVQESAA